MMTLKSAAIRASIAYRDVRAIADEGSRRADAEEMQERAIAAARAAKAAAEAARQCAHADQVEAWGIAAKAAGDAYNAASCVYGWSAKFVGRKKG